MRGASTGREVGVGVEGGGGGGEDGLPFPSSRNVCNFPGKTQMIRPEVLGRKHSKRLSRPGLSATVLIPKT